MAKYKVGDKVRVITNGKLYETYWMEGKSGRNSMVGEMLTFSGKIVTITNADNSGYRVAECSGWGWVDEMFEGLAEEESKFKVGDRVIATDNIGKYREEPGTILEVTDPSIHKEPYLIKFDKGGNLYGKAHRLIEEQPTPTPTNINITINLYENACWYCRKGGLVDLYLNGAMGICPSCGRVCNNTVPTPKKESVVNDFKPRKNEPLTLEQVLALPDGTRVFTVKIRDGKEVNDEMTCWRTWDTSTRKLNRRRGHYYVDKHCGINSGWRVYLEMPEGFVDSGA